MGMVKVLIMEDYSDNQMGWHMDVFDKCVLLLSLLSLLLHKVTEQGEMMKQDT